MKLGKGVMVRVLTATGLQCEGTIIGYHEAHGSAYGGVTVEVHKPDEFTPMFETAKMTHYSSY